MLIQGMHGVLPDKASASKDAIWTVVESGQATAIAKGALCAWDTTDNAAVAGILQNTWGLRVVVYPTAEKGATADGLSRMAGFAHTAMDATPANTRGKTYLVQTYGYRNDITANTDAASNIIVGGVIVPAGDAAGAVEGPAVEATVALAESLKVVGMSFEAVAINTTATISAFIKGIM